MKKIAQWLFRPFYERMVKPELVAMEARIKELEQKTEDLDGSVIVLCKDQHLLGLRVQKLESDG